MPYCLQAVIAKKEQILTILPEQNMCIELEQGFAMFPLVTKITNKFDISTLPLIDAGEHELPIQISEFCYHASLRRGSKISQVFLISVKETRCGHIL